MIKIIKDKRTIMPRYVLHFYDPEDIDDYDEMINWMVEMFGNPSRRSIGCVQPNSSRWTYEPIINLQAEIMIFGENDDIVFRLKYQHLFRVEAI